MIKLSRHEARALLAVSSTDAGRVNLNGVYLHGPTGTAVATDGHRLILRDPRGDFTAQDRSALVTRDAWETMCKVAKSADYEITIRAKGASVEIFNRKGESLGTLTLATRASTFPPYHQVIPADLKPGACAAVVNPAYLADAMASLSKAGCGEIAIKPGAKVLEPVGFYGHTEDGSWVYVLMPLRGNVAPFRQTREETAAQAA
ncbi:hypothetical protein LCGC14_1883280 [marine sediment metagenome]|uniref:DNA polymerase III beta sliding clamp central domain-containing protein n=1 Tax=marine sediment metagenome TaxID=412755 RepID=A0A0F9GPY0_9ZZZZ